MSVSKTLDDLEILINPGLEMWKIIAKEISINQGWQFRNEDYENFISTFKEFILYVAVERSTRKFVASIFVALDEASESLEKLYSIGCYYCNPEWRLLNVGTTLFKKVMAVIGEENAVLNGAANMAPKYASKFGFDKMPPWRHKIANFNSSDVVSVDWNGKYTFKDVRDVDYLKVLAFDNTVTSRPRPKFLKKWTEPSEIVFTKVLINEADDVVGFVSFHVDVMNNIHVGPLYAKDKDSAKALLSTSLQEIAFSKYGPLQFMYPQCNEAADALFIEITNGKVEFIPSCQLAFTKHIVPQDPHKVFSMMECAASFV